MSRVIQHVIRFFFFFLQPYVNEAEYECIQKFINFQVHDRANIKYLKENERMNLCSDKKTDTLQK